MERVESILHRKRKGHVIEYGVNTFSCLDNFRFLTSRVDFFWSIFSITCCAWVGSFREIAMHRYANNVSKYFRRGYCSYDYENGLFTHTMEVSYCEAEEMDDDDLLRILLYSADKLYDCAIGIVMISDGSDAETEAYFSTRWTG